MNLLQACLLFTGISFCLGFVLLSRRLFVHLSLRYFSVYLVLASLSLGFEWLLVHPETPYKAAWLALLMANSFLMAPCVWLFAKEIDQNRPAKLWPLAWGQCAVIVAGATLCIPLFIDANQSTLLVDPARANTELSLPIHSTMIAAILLYLLQVPWYLSRCLQLFRKRLRIIQFLFSNIDEPALNALRALIWVMAANWVLNLSRMLQVMLFDPSMDWELLITVSEVGVLVAALYAIFQCCWKYSYEDQAMLQSLAPETNNQSESSKYAKSPLDKTTRARIVAKVLAQFEEKQIHHVSGLKLQNLCDATAENVHYVSQVINQDMKLSFFDLVNQHRINDAKIKLKENSNLSILEIALEVGFNSKSTFNKAFKQQTGKTPSEYRNL